MRNRSKIKPTGRQTCLIIEDSTFDQEKIKRIINRSFQNMDVLVASKLDVARQKMANETVHLILLDNSLPDGNGANFAVELSQNNAFNKIPVIMISDFPTPFMFHKAQSAGVKHILDKSEFGARHIHDVMAPALKKTH